MFQTLCSHSMATDRINFPYFYAILSYALLIGPACHRCGKKGRRSREEDKELLHLWFQNRDMRTPHPLGGGGGGEIRARLESFF